MGRSNGEGTIYQRDDGRWCGQVTLGRDSKGKVKRKTFYGKTRKEVARKMTELQHRLYAGTYIEPSNIPLRDWLNQWIEGRKPHLAENSWRTYRMFIEKHIIPVIGDIKLKDLSTRHIQNLINNKFESGNRKSKNKKGLSRRSVKYIYSTLHTALEQAVKESLIPRNVCKAVELPKKTKKKKMKPYTSDQVKKFLKAARDSRFYTAFYLELHTGLRKGELLGLKWKDLDYEDKTITVERQLLRTQENGLILREPKTESSLRRIPINGKVIQKLKSHKIKQNENKLFLGIYCIIELPGIAELQSQKLQSKIPYYCRIAN